jgi:hypothetical protein
LTDVSRVVTVAASDDAAVPDGDDTTVTEASADTEVAAASVAGASAVGRARRMTISPDDAARGDCFGPTLGDGGGRACVDGSTARDTSSGCRATTAAEDRVTACVDAAGGVSTFFVAPPCAVTLADGDGDGERDADGDARTMATVDDTVPLVTAAAGAGVATAAACATAGGDAAGAAATGATYCLTLTADGASAGGDSSDDGDVKLVGDASGGFPSAFDDGTVTLSFGPDMIVADAAPLAGWCCGSGGGGGGAITVLLAKDADAACPAVLSSGDAATMTTRGDTLRGSLDATAPSTA